MKRIGAAVLAASLLTLAGCSAGATQEDACRGMVDAIDSIGRAFTAASQGKTGDEAEVYLELILGAADDVRAVGGPAEFVELRDQLASAVVAFGEKGVEVAHGRASFATEQAEVMVLLSSVEAYCPEL